MMFIVFLFLFFLQTSHSFLTQSPIWKTSIYFRAGQQNVINTLTGNDKTPNYTFTFSSALSGTPNIAYGIGKYQGIDYLMEEYFEIFRIGLTSTSFSVAVQITGSTSLYILRVPYLAIEPTFPHHLNTFDNIPVNYSAGNLVNITSRSLVSQTIYQNVINYTQQCGSRTYNKFNSSLQNYKIALLMTSLFVSTIKETSVSQNYSMDLRMSYTIMSESLYQLKVRLKINVIVTRLRFSQIVFDATDIASSNKYKLIFEQWEVDNLGGTKEIPSQFKDNFIMAISEFTTPHGYCGFDYMWDWKDNGTFFGVVIYESITRKNVCAFNRIISAVVYIQTWKCIEPYYYYNASTGLCQDECGLYFYGMSQMVDIEWQYWCKPCQWGCSKCSNTNKCIQCNSDDMRVFNGSCYCPYGYLDTYIVTKCQPCVDPNCLICQKNVNYDSNLLPTDSNINASKNLCILCADRYYLNQTTKTCSLIPICDPSLNQILNYQTYTCQQCQLTGCLQCRQTLQLKFNNTLMDVMQVGRRKRSLISTSPYGIVSCALCDQNNHYFMNLTTKSCQSCAIQNCLKCSSLYTCSLCDSIGQYFLNKKSKQCELCYVEGCIECMNLTTCRRCDNLRGYFLDQQSKNCTYCGMGCNECVIGSNSLMSSYCRRCESELYLIKDRCFCSKGRVQYQIQGYYLTVLVGEQESSCIACDSKCKRCQNQSNLCTACYFQQNRLLNQNNSCQCNVTNYIQSLVSNTCQKVNLSLCDMGYYIVEQSKGCQQICGDGVRIEVECDDGNMINRDGCNSQCRIQTDFQCTNEIYQLSQCNYIGQVRVSEYNVTKQAYENVFVLLMKLQPQLVLYNKLLWKNRLRFQGSASIELVDAYMIDQQVLLVRARYYENIKQLNVTLKFITLIELLSSSLSLPHIPQSPSLSFQQSITNRLLQPNNNRLLQSIQQQQININITFTFIDVNLTFQQTSDNLQVVYYQQSLYKTAKQFQSAIHIISIIYLVIILPTLFFSKRIVPVLIVCVSLQLCYTSLITIQHIHPFTFTLINNLHYIYGINNLNIFNTYCIKQQPITITLDSVFNMIGFQKCLLSNMNLMIVFQLVAIVGILLCKLIEIKYKGVRRYKDIFKRALNNLVLFNLPRLVISLSLIQWTNISYVQIGLACFLILITFIEMFLIVKYKREYYIKISIQDFIYSIQQQKRNNKQNKQQQHQDQDQSRQQKSQYLKDENSSNQSQTKIKNPSNSNININITNRQRQSSQSESKSKSLSQSKQQKRVNYQVSYLFSFIIGIGCLSPLIIVLIKEYVLISNLSIIGIMISLISIQIILNPFKSTNPSYHSFTKISTNYYITYTFSILLLTINLLYQLIENIFNLNQIQQKTSASTLISYFQIGFFLTFLSYFLVAQFYTVYLSFFQTQVLKSHHISPHDQKSSLKSQKSSLKSQKSQQKSDKLIEQSSLISKYQQQDINGSMKRKYQFSIRRNIPKSLINSFSTKIGNKSQDIIFELDQDEDHVKNYRF